MKFVDYTGMTFGDLYVEKRVPNPNGKPKWKCNCSCGNTVYRLSNALRTGCTDCGCKSKKHLSGIESPTATHGLSKTRIYKIYMHMKERCYKQESSSYIRYGGRGITICDEWLNNFQSFYDWAMNNGYREDLTIDRIDNNKGYCPSNCRWVTNEIQSNNRRNNRYVTLNGITKSVSDWSRQTGIKPATIIARLNKGWSVEKALLAPLKRVKGVMP